MGIIKVENIRVFAHHGCLKEETVIGSLYRVDLKVWANLKKAAITDNLLDTVDYVLLNKIVVEEMATPSKLLEQVCQRIIKRIFKEDPLCRRARIQISKINPPIGGDVEKVSVALTEKRKNL